MSAIEIIFGTGYLVAALLAGLGVIFFFATLLHVERHSGALAQPAFIPVIAVGICASTLLSGRSLTNAAYDLTLNTEGVTGGGSMVLRLLTITLIGICTARIAGQWLRSRQSSPTGGTGLFVAFVAFFVSNNVLNSILGTAPVFIHNLFYPLFVFAAVYAARREPLAPTIAMAKAALFGLMFLSLAVAAVKPELALEPGYKGWIPGLSVRLWGVGSNANSIGPLALVALLIAYFQPYQKKWLQWLFVTITMGVFILAQSKTVWLVGVLLLPVLIWYRMVKPKSGIDIRIVLALITLGSLLLLAALVVDPVSLLEKVSRTKAGSDISTLSGRGQIWMIAIDEWLNNPLFGYGPDIWGPAYRARIGLQFAFSAHNQFLQSLSAAGTLGFFSLMTYLWLLGRYSFRASRKTKGVSLALFFLIVLRCVTETPLAINTLFNGEILVHLLLFQIVIRCDWPASSKESQASMRLGAEFQLTKLSGTQ
jgi:O-antigen ligase